MSSTRTRERRIAERLRAVRPPGEGDALERALELAEELSIPGAAPLVRPSRRRGLMALAGALLAAALLTLTPAGATVTNWIGDAVDSGPAPRPALRAVPAGGSLLVESPAGAWVVQADGSRRLLGDYRAASWSPRGLYAAVSSGRELSAVEPDGTPHWTIPTTGHPSGIRWAPSGQRIAYLTDDGADGLASLELVAGDGTGRRRLANAVQPVAPAWKPVEEGASSENALAYVDRYGLVRAIDVDDGEGLGRTSRTSGMPQSIAWIGPRRLIAVEGDRIEELNLDGPATTLLRVPAGRIASATYSPATDAIAVLAESGPDARPRSRLILLRSVSGGDRSGGERTLFSGLGRYQRPVFSPDGSLVQLGWPAANQWLFVATEAGEARRVMAVGSIRNQFDSGDGGVGSFPAVSGWCCG